MKSPVVSVRKKASAFTHQTYNVGELRAVTETDYAQAVDAALKTMDAQKKNERSKAKGAGA